MSSSARLLPSLDIIHRTIAAELAYTLSRMKVLENLPGNPIGIAYRQIDDGLVALMARHLPSPSFNNVVGLRAGQERHIEPIVAWYRDNGAKGRFAIVPGDFDPALGRELARLGYYQSGFHASLIAEPDLQPAIPGGITVERVASAAAMEDFLAAYVAGWGIPENEQDRFKANVRPWLGQSGWSLYVARIDATPRAAAVLYVHDKAAYLADAASDPVFRGRGLHTALLRRRLRDAQEAGVDFAFSGAAFLSASHRNMERVGMRLQFVRSIWTSLD